MNFVKIETVDKLLMNTYFVLTIISILAALLVVSMKICFASKCQEFSLCFCLFTVKRDVSIEDKEFHGDIREQIQEFKQMNNEINRVQEAL